MHLPPSEFLPDHSPHVMALSSLGLEVQDTHSLIAGHRSAEEAHHEGWPQVSSRPSPPTGTAPPIGRCHAVSATIPTFSWLPQSYGILHDASSCPRTRRCGGAVAVFCPVTLWFQIYFVAIPLRLDNAYARGAIHGVGGPYRPRPLGRPHLRFPVQLMALRRLQGIHHGPRGTAGTGRLTARRPNTRVPCYGRRPPSPSPLLLPHRRHLARRPPGPSGRSRRTVR